LSRPFIHPAVVRPGAPTSKKLLVSLLAPPAIML
jgi:hypothetical protein